MRKRPFIGRGLLFLTEAYLKLWQIIREEDRIIESIKLAAWKRYGLLSDGELDAFSEETRERIRHAWIFNHPFAALIETH